MKFLVNLDLVQNELQNVVIQNLATAPSSPKTGQIYFNTSTKVLYQYDGENWKAAGGEYVLPAATTSTLGGVKVGTGLTATVDGTLSIDTVAWSKVTGTPTTLSGYGITDAKITNGTITLGTANIVPITTIKTAKGDKTGSTVTITAADLEALPLAGGTMTGAIAMGTNKITGLGTPAADADAATKAYVDTASANTVKYTAQTLSDTQKTQARTNIGAGDGDYNNLKNKPTIDTAMDKDSTNAVQNKVIKAYVDGIIAASQGIVYKGTINKTADIPTTYNVGWLYIIGTAGTYVGEVCEVGDLMVAVVKRSGSGNLDTDWDVIQTNIDGAITSITGTAPIDVSGSANSKVVALKTSGVTAGAYGDTSNQTPTFGGTFKVPSFTVDSYGRLTVAGSHTVTIPSSVASGSANGLMSSSDYTLLHKIESAYVTKGTATITVGSTSTTASIGTSAVLHSVYAYNATSGEQLTIDAKVVNGTATFSINAAQSYAIKVDYTYA